MIARLALLFLRPSLAVGIEHHDTAAVQATPDLQTLTPLCLYQGLGRRVGHGREAAYGPPVWHECRRHCLQHAFILSRRELELNVGFVHIYKTTHTHALARVYTHTHTVTSRRTFQHSQTDFCGVNYWCLQCGFYSGKYGTCFCIVKQT